MKLKTLHEAKKSPVAETGFDGDIEKLTIENNNFRKVLYTTHNTQLVLMTLKVGEDIGEEVHKDGSQFFRFEEGQGVVKIGEKEVNVKDGSAVIVPQGMLHNVSNTGSSPLKLYALYSPPQHDDGVVDKNKP